MHDKPLFIPVILGTPRQMRWSEHAARFVEKQRELGLVTIFWDVNFSHVQKLFDAKGNLLDPSYVHRAGKFLNELIWMAKVLRAGREGVALA